MVTPPPAPVAVIFTAVAVVPVEVTVVPPVPERRDAAEVVALLPIVVVKPEALIKVISPEAVAELRLVRLITFRFVIKKPSADGYLPAAVICTI